MAKWNEIVGNIPNGQTLGEWIRAARLGSEFPTQVAFAAALGLKQAHLSKLERGDLRPSREVLNRIARLTQRALGDRQAVLELDGLRLAAPALQAAGAVAGLVVRVPGADAILLRHVRAAFEEIADRLAPGRSLPEIEPLLDPVAQFYSHLSPEQIRQMEACRLPEDVFVKAFPNRDSAILDVGCGGGHNAALLKRLGYRVQGVDAVPAMIAQANRRYPDLKGRLDVGRLPGLRKAVKERFDGVVCANVLQELPQAELLPAVGELADYLKPGGRLVLSVPEKPEQSADQVFPQSFEIPEDDLRCLLKYNGMELVARQELDSQSGRSSLLISRKAA